MSADAALRLTKISDEEKNESAVTRATDQFIAAATRHGLHETAVTPSHFSAMEKILGENRKALTDRLAAMIESPQNYGPEEIREINRFRVGMKLAGEPFPAAFKIDRVVKYVRKNMTQKAITEDLNWRGTDRQAWHIEPLEAHLSLAPGESKTIEFHVNFDRDRGEMLPLPSLKSVINRKDEKVVEQIERVPVDTRKFRDDHIARCVRAAKPPTIDGKLDDDAWTRAKPTSILFSYDAFTPTQETQVLTCYDEKGLYIAIRAFENDMEHVLATDVKRDGDICKNDSIEMMLNPKPEQDDYFQVILNTKNTQYDGIGWDRTFDFKWKSAVGIDEKGWVVEFHIPWTEIAVEETPKAGDKFLTNFYRNRYRGQEYVLSQWSPSFVINNHKSEYYGTLLFE